jgi:hypothetical protein
MLLPIVLLAACAEPGPGYGWPGAAPPGSVVPSPSQPVGPYTGAPAGSYIGPQATFLCDDRTSVLVQPGIGSATAKLNSGFELPLPHRGGGWYGLPPEYDFRLRGAEALWSVGGRAPVLCSRIS